MYKTKDITKQQLKKLEIKNQDEIVELTGSKLNPLVAWEVIKKTSNNFSTSDLKAEEADALLFKMLDAKSKKTKTTSKEEQILRLKERERTRALELLELELLIAA